MSVRIKQSSPLPPISNGTKGSNAVKQKRKQKKVHKRTKVVRGSSAAQRVEKFYLSPCSYKYLKALCNPFCNISGVCIPDLIDRPSRKIITLQRGTFNVNNQGVGYIGASSRCITRSGNSVAYSLAGGISPQVSSLAAESVLTDNRQFPYNLIDLTNGVYEARQVAVGLRARYAGTELDRSGRIIAGRLPGNQSFFTHTMATILSAHNEIESWPCDREWHQVVYLPMGEADFAYQDQDQSMTIGGPDNCDLLVMVDGASTANHAGFEWECCRYFELIPGSNFNGTMDNLTGSHSDVAGMSAIRGFFEGNVTHEGGDSYFNSALKWVQTFTPEDVSHFVSGVSKIVRLYDGF